MRLAADTISQTNRQADEVCKLGPLLLRKAPENIWSSILQQLTKWQRPPASCWEIWCENLGSINGIEFFDYTYDQQLALKGYDRQLVRYIFE